MGWSMSAIMCGQNFLGYAYRSLGGSFAATHCASVQQKQNSKQINQPGKPYIAPDSPEDMTGSGKLVDKKTGFVYPKSYEKTQNTHMKGQCVSLVRGAVPALDVQTSNWRKGETLDKNNIIKMTPGTAIGYGWAGNKYPSNASGNHVAIFQGYSEKTGKITVVDQWHHNAKPAKDGKPAKPETLQKPTRRELPLKGHNWATVTLKGRSAR